MAIRLNMKSLKANVFHYVLCIERSERNGYKYEDKNQASYYANGWNFM